MIAWWERRTRADWILAIVAILGWRAARWTSLVGPLDLIDPSARRAVYVQAGVVGTATIALFVVPISLVLAFATRERLQKVLASKHGQLRSSALQASISASILIVYSVVAVALEATPTGNRLVRVLGPGVFTLAVAGLIRILYTFNAIMHLSELEASPKAGDTVRPIRGDRTA